MTENIQIPAIDQSLETESLRFIRNLTGRFDRNLDKKSRISLPSQIRDKLGTNVIYIIKWFNRNLALFPEPNYLLLAESVAKTSNPYSPEGMDIRQIVFSECAELVLDKEGRFLLPQYLIDYAQLNQTDKILLLGDWDKVKICNSSVYESRSRTDPQHLEKTMSYVMTEAFASIYNSKK
ncbi:MAG: division/cell wall cluster transcriptional repressor MraZ [bacterium]|jgi:MraZ protein